MLSRMHSGKSLECANEDPLILSSRYLLSALLEVVSISDRLPLYSLADGFVLKRFLLADWNRSFLMDFYSS